MKLYIFPLFFISAFLLACSEPRAQLGSAADYFPSASHLSEGVVNKYYYHFKSADSYEETTDIQYRHYQALENGDLLETIYNPAMEPVKVSTLAYQNGKLILKEEVRYFREDTLISEVIAPDHSNWEADSSYLETLTTFSSGITQRVSQQRTYLRDTTVIDRPARLVKRKQVTVNTYINQEQKTFTGLIEELFVAGIGLWEFQLDLPKGTGKLELIEQIPYAQFKEIANHQVHRIGYIDPGNVMDDPDSLQLCHHPKRIADYYNGKGGFEGGKKALWQQIEQKLDNTKLKQASGYLTFRFIVNCRGEAGWFTTEEADLTYQKKTFDVALVSHLFEILSELNEWRPCTVRGETRDAYFYITFKLEDGELIEILP